MRRKISIAIVAVALLTTVTQVLAQGLFTRRASFFGWMPGSKETMRGSITMSAITLSGTIRGKTNKGIKCVGRARINAALNRGKGSMRCGDGRSGTFSYTLSSRLPPRGKGKGRLKTGERVLFRISP